MSPIKELEKFLGECKSARVKKMLEGHINELKEEEKKEAEKAKEAEKKVEKAKAEKAKPERTAKPGELVVDGMGNGMMDDMAEYVDNSKIQFGLVKIPIGSGTFTRNKMINVVWAGEECPPLKRAKAMQKAGEVAKLFGATHATYNISQKSECNLDAAVKELKSVFVTDSGNFSTAQLRAEMEKRIKEAQPASPSGARKTAKDLGIKEDTVLLELRKSLGKFNWCLLEPSPDPLKMFNAGSKSIEEMHEYLEEDKVLFGLLRLGFGSGAYRRTKWICVTFVGEKVGPIARGKQVQCRGAMESALKPFSISIEVHGKEEATIEAIIDKVQGCFVKDDFDKSDINLVDAFKEALAEEIEENAAFFGDEEVCGG
eukprot:TRINITY_DN6097_c0_g1_i2.p1 TRINITY_DN6097_c0_g1~~TRINITY_DN6097_c0_g1_i2.p1  ORF type:complete len:371 (+),score=157.94 TRINITY_DN6097_c0_g1_i2:47-1159(+)